MKTDLWIVFAQDSKGNICLADTYESELDPLPGMRKVLAALDPEVVNSQTFFGVRITAEQAVSLHKIETAPTVSAPLQSLVFGVSCTGCRNSLATNHSCETSQGQRS